MASNNDNVVNMISQAQRIHEINSYFKIFGAIVFCTFVGTGIHLSGGNLNTVWNFMTLSCYAIFGFTFPVISVPVGLIGSVINILKLINRV